jgi:capsular exopolysaccharide synthesis family protein
MQSEPNEIVEYTPRPQLPAMPMAQPQPVPPPAEPPRAFEVDLLEVIRGIWRQRRTVLGVTALGTLAAVGATLLITPIYTSYTSVMLESRRNQVFETQAVLTDLTPTVEVIETEIEMVRSRAIMERVAMRAELPRLLAERERAAGDGPMQVALSWVENVLLSRVMAMAPDELARNLPGMSRAAPEEAQPITLDDAVMFLAENLSTRQVGGTAVLDIGFSDPDRTFAAKIANLFAAEYLQEQIAWKTQATDSANTWLEAQITELQAEIGRKRGEYEALRSESGELNNGGDSLSAQRQILTNERLLETRSERIRLETEVGSLRRLLAAAGPEQIAARVESDVMSELRLEVSAAKRRLAELGTIYGSRHPLLLDAKAQLDQALRDVETEAGRALASRENALAALRSEEATLQATLSRDSDAGRALGSQRSSIAALQSEIETMQTVLDGYLARFNQTAEQHSIIRPDARIISNAVPSKYPSSPSRTTLVLLGFVAAGMAGMILGYLRDATDRTLRSLGAAERTLGVPILGAIPTLPGNAKRQAPVDYAIQRPGSAFVEGIRNLVVGIGLAQSANAPRSLLVTSAIAGEGKSTTAATMGRLMARAGYKVCLVECDLRRPSLAAALRCAPGVGLVQFLQREAGLADIIQQDPVTGMSVITAGGTADNSLFLLQSEEFRRLFTYLTTGHQLVILDAPPVTPISDAQVVADMVDAVLYLCRWGATPKATSSAGVRMLVRRGGAHVFGALSQVDTKAFAAYEQSYAPQGAGHYYTN